MFNRNKAPTTTFDLLSWAYRMCWFPLLAILGLGCCFAAADQRDRREDVLIGVVTVPRGQVTGNQLHLDCPHCSFTQAISCQGGLPSGTEAHFTCSLCLKRIDFTLGPQTCQTVIVNPAAVTVAVATAV